MVDEETRCDRYIYKITDLTTGDTYVGQHKHDTRNGKADKYMGSGTLIRKAIKEKGIKNFKKEILLRGQFTSSEIDRFERCAIAWHVLIGQANLNITKGGRLQSLVGGDRSQYIDYEFAKRRQREVINEKLKKDPDYYKKIALKRKGKCSHPCAWKGKKNPHPHLLTEEGRRKLSEATTLHNKQRGEDVKAKVRESLRALYADDLKVRISFVQSRILEGLQNNMKIEELSRYAEFGGAAQLRMWLRRHNLNSFPILRKQFKETGSIIL